MGFAAFVLGVIVLGIIYTHKNIKEIDDVVDDASDDDNDDKKGEK